MGPLAVLTLSLLSAANADLASATRAFEEGAYDKVLPLTRRALASDLDAKERLRAHELEAMTHAAFDRSTEAIEAFREVLRLDPTWSPPADASPKVLGLFQRAAQAAPERFLPSPQAQAGALPTGDRSPASEATTAPLYKRWWFWGAAAVVATGAAAATWSLTHPPVPQGNLGVRTLP